MTSRFLNAVLATAFALLLALAFPVAAAMTPTQQARMFAQFREIKHRMIMQGAQQKILKARLAAKPHKKLPHGLHILPSREHEPGIGLPARVQSLRDAGVLPPAGSLAAGASKVSRVQAGAFGANKRANDPSTDTYTDAGQSETSMAAYGNNILIAWNDGNGFDQSGPPGYQLISYGYSTDGGVTWTDGGTMPTPSLTGPTPYPNWMWSSDPVVAVNEATGEFVFAGLCFPDGAPSNFGFVGIAGDTNGVAVMKGSFSGPAFVWQQPKLVVSANNGNTFHDKEWVTVDPATGNLYLTYTRFTLVDDRIEFRRSTDGGANWSTATPLSAVSDNGYVQGSRIGVGPNGELYSVWQAIGLVDKDYFKMRKSANAGASWGTEVQAADYYANFSSGAPGFNRERGITYPSLAIDRTSGPSRGRVYLAWNESLNYYQDLLTGVSTGDVSEPESGSQVVNNTFATATPFTLGNTVRGTISNIDTDFDFYKFTATQGQTCIFWVDSLSSGLDMAFRLFCSDQFTRLAISSPGQGFQNLIVWTCPANGTYYIRPAAWPAPSSAPGSHGYRIRTYVHTPIGSDRARDHRDIFVASSADGLIWPLSGPGSPTRVNDDPPYYDDWLPEVAVTGNSRVFCTWFDWRDSAPGTCGGQSNLYLYRSENAGANWSNLGLMTDATTAWTSTVSNVAPNQGDYISLYGNSNGLYASWGDGRDGNPNAYMLAIPIVTPTQAALATSTVSSDRVEMRWQVPDAAGQTVQLERRELSEWTTLDQATVDGSGYAEFVDASVVAGHTYDYRLALGGSDYSQIARIAVPSGVALSLAMPQPNPVVSDLWVSFSLPTAAPATLSLVDIAGRVVRSREVGSLGPGTHRVNLTEGALQRPGVYIVTLRQAGRTLTRRVSVVR